MGSGTTVDEMALNFSMGMVCSFYMFNLDRFLQDIHRVDNLPGDGCGCGCDRTGKHGAGTRTLPSFKVSIGGRYRKLTFRNLIIVHGQAGRTSCMSHAEPGFFK